MAMVTFVGTNYLDKVLETAKNKLEQIKNDPIELTSRTRECGKDISTISGFLDLIWWSSKNEILLDKSDIDILKKYS